MAGRYANRKSSAQYADNIDYVKYSSAGAPRAADHTVRRTQITYALVRVAARDGLHAVTTEAGISLRLIQYYFH